jgi:hypothetical protein
VFASSVGRIEGGMTIVGGDGMPEGTQAIGDAEHGERIG